MKYTEHRIEATHEEMVSWLDWRCREMLKSGADPKYVQGFAVGVSAWLSTGNQYLRKDEDKCEVCEGTGQSKLLVGRGHAPCHACKGTGHREKLPPNAVLFPSEAIQTDAKED